MPAKSAKRKRGLGTSPQRGPGAEPLAFLVFLAFSFSAWGSSPIKQALQSQDWPQAHSLAEATHDPLAPTLVDFFRLLTPNEGTPPEIAAFIDAHPSFPQQTTLRRRLAEAIAREPEQNAAAVLADCRAYHPTLDTALLRCAAAERDANQPAKAAALARQAWLTGITSAPQEAAFLLDWHHIITETDQWRRFDWLDWSGNAAADRQAGRLDAAHHPLAAARLAFRHTDPHALETLPTIPPAQRDDPALILAQARYLRATLSLPAALALWRAAGAAAETAAPPDRRPAFTTERERLARALLDSGDNEGAYFLTDDAHASADQAPDTLFLAGWIALRRLHDSARATAKFQALAAQSPAVLTQSRAYYWLARAAAEPAAARANYTRAAAWPTTWYGQLAIAATDGAAAIPQHLAALLETPPPPAPVTNDIETNELVHAARLLQSWEEDERAREFFLRLTLDNAGNVTALAAIAQQATKMNLPSAAVQATRFAGKDGTVLKSYGWPIPYHPPTADNVDEPLALSIMRQESGFDPGIISAAGAVGLMQMMPATARQQDIGAGDLTDPATNMRLGVSYLQKIMTRFNNVVPYAVAAYNAGPRRVQSWLETNDASGKSLDDMIDWIELIPFNETRNYVQRVEENRAIYAAALKLPQPAP